MKWLIVEDALRDKKGHWFEYIRTFRCGLMHEGDEVTVLADRNVELFIREQLDAKPVLPASIWHRMSDGAKPWKRYLRVPVHAWQTWRCVRIWLKNNQDYDLIFVPTVSLHHLLGWLWLIKRVLKGKRTRVLLYFLSLPITLTSDGQARWVNSLTTSLLRWIFRRLQSSVMSGRVVLGVETVPLKQALETLTNLPVCYLPQPVEAFAKTPESASTELLMGCYGGARCEKGSDLLQLAIVQYLKHYPQSRTRFAVQWVDDFQNEQGEWVRMNPILVHSERVTFIRKYFGDGEYGDWLGQTQVMLLPYRRSSYGLRGSRVIIEAMVNGIPVVVACGTTLAEQAERFGAAIPCEDGDLASLVEAMHQAEQNYHALKEQAEKQKAAAREHFSVAEFRRITSLA